MHHIFLRDRQGENLNNEARFQVWLHESFHFVSHENGAGLVPQTDDLADNFYIPDDCLEDNRKMNLIGEGLRALCEGATQIMTESSEIDMGFSEISSAYPVETRLVSLMIDLIGKEKFQEIYLTMPLEELRFKFEAINKEAKPEYENTFATGEFAYFLIDVGECSSYCNTLLHRYGFSDYEIIDSCIYECVGLLEKYLNPPDDSRSEAA